MTNLRPPGVLFVVATPLGNLDDLSPRALRTLKSVRWVACEDTRHTGHLLHAHGVDTPTISYHEHNEAARTPDLVGKLLGGDSLALVCDAGTPGISDPGERLVAAASRAGVPVVPIPGPSAVIAALSVSGLPTTRFLFAGFLPSRAGDRRRAIDGMGARTETIVFYESPVRIRATVADLLASWGERPAFLCREATKLHEEYLRAPLSALALSLAARERVKGEIVLIVGGASTASAIDEAVDPLPLVRKLRAEGLAPRAAAREAARLSGRPARELYRLLIGRPEDHD